MVIDPRDALWNEAHDLLYRVNYAVALKAALLSRWVWLDSITKIAVAISSGGAALAGLVFWQNKDYTFLWPMFTSASALLAIISKHLSVAEKLQAHATSAGSLSALGIDRDTGHCQPGARPFNQGEIMIFHDDPRRRYEPPNPIPPPPQRPK